jgi:hypothetical protein
VSLIDNYQARVVIQDANQTNYQVKEEAFKRPVESFEARLTQVGFAVKSDDENPFFF